MINNIVYAQPQVGISNADIIYEIPAEGGITRMMAIFSHLYDIESVGSIRSLRPYYLSVACRMTPSSSMPAAVSRRTAM